MNKLVISLVFLLLSIGAGAQVQLNVFWKNKAEDGTGVINYKSSSGLRWSDFKGKPVLNTREAALTSAGCGYDLSIRTSGNEATINVAVFCFFSQKESWVRPDGATPYILNHEQRHFDITFLAANLFYEKIKSLRLNSTNADKVIAKVYAEANDWHQQMQKQYDLESRHSTIAESQSVWDSLIVNKLEAIRLSQ